MDENNPRLRDSNWIRTVPGWCLLAATIYLVMTRENVSETLVGTLLGVSLVLLGVPLALPGRK